MFVLGWAFLITKCFDYLLSRSARIAQQQLPGTRGFDLGAPQVRPSRALRATIFANSHRRYLFFVVFFKTAKIDRRVIVAVRTWPSLLGATSAGHISLCHSSPVSFSSAGFCSLRRQRSCRLFPSLSSRFQLPPPPLSRNNITPLWLRRRGAIVVIWPYPIQYQYVRYLRGTVNWHGDAHVVFRLLRYDVRRLVCGRFLIPLIYIQSASDTVRMYQ